MQKTKEYQGKMEEIKKLQKDAIQERIEKETYSDCLTHLEDKGWLISEGILISVKKVFTKNRLYTEVEFIFFSFSSISHLRDC